MNLHIKLKHNGGFKTEREKVAVKKNFSFLRKRFSVLLKKGSRYLTVELIFLQNIWK
jgi:hypothetical protein